MGASVQSCKSTMPSATAEACKTHCWFLYGQPCGSTAWIAGATKHASSHARGSRQSSRGVCGTKLHIAWTCKSQQHTFVVLRSGCSCLP